MLRTRKDWQPPGGFCQSFNYNQLKVAGVSQSIPPQRPTGKPHLAFLPTRGPVGLPPLDGVVCETLLKDEQCLLKGRPR
jgi:hypothetical protein